MEEEDFEVSDVPISDESSEKNYKSCKLASF